MIGVDKFGDILQVGRVYNFNNGCSGDRLIFLGMNEEYTEREHMTAAKCFVMLNNKPTYLFPEATFVELHDLQPIGKLPDSFVQDLISRFDHMLENYQKLSLSRDQLDAMLSPIYPG